MTSDVREGGAWSLPQRIKNDALWILASASLASASRLPRPLLRTCGDFLGRVAHALLPGPRRLAERNVSRAFGDLDTRSRRALVKTTYRALGRLLGETVATYNRPSALEPLPFSENARVVLDQAVAEGHGVVFASAHLGPWERVAASLVHAGIPLTVVAREAYDPRMRRIYDGLRTAHGVPAIYRGAPASAVRMFRTLRKGDVLGVPMDLASRVPSIDVPFLGTRAPTPVGPARLALRAGAAVVVGTAVPDASSEGIAIGVSRILTSDLAPSPEGERTLTERINEELSHRIRALPHAWVWMHPRWPTL